jgi:hypothetical protein
MSKPIPQFHCDCLEPWAIPAINNLLVRKAMRQLEKIYRDIHERIHIYKRIVRHKGSQQRRVEVL